MTVFAGSVMMSCGGGEDAADALNGALEDIENMETDMSTDVADEDGTAEDTDAGMTETTETDMADDNSGSEETEKMLNDYEEYVDEYVVLYKKAMAGDQTAMSEYPALMQKASDLQQSMAEAQANGNWSSEQIQRMMDIQQKMSNAAMGG